MPEKMRERVHEGLRRTPFSGSVRFASGIIGQANQRSGRRLRRLHPVTDSLAGSANKTNPFPLNRTMPVSAPPSAAPSASTPAGAPARDARLDLLQSWLGTLVTPYLVRPETIAPASSDASFRRYFRVLTRDTSEPSLIIMDAPPAQEDCAPFICVAQRFAEAGLTVPRVLAQNLEDGFLLLTDLGATTYLARLSADTADNLYRDAGNALIRLQAASRPTGLADYDRAMLLRELELFPEWYVAKHHGHALTPAERSDLNQVFEVLLTNNLAQPQVDVHRDYHSRNLMVMEANHDPRHKNPGILDFQDAVRGPITYDLVSLLRDAYIQWDEERVLDWAIRYWEGARRAQLPVAADFSDFWVDFEWMGLQRHLKVLGIFARLFHRDGKENYLRDLPLVLHYTRRTAERYRPFKPLLRLLDRLEKQASGVGYTF